MMKSLIRAAAFGATLLPAAALAQTAGSVTADLNLRQGPGSNYGVITTIPNGAEVVINGCVEGTKWCEVNYDNTNGFAFSDYLMVATGGETVVISERPSLVPGIGFDSDTTAGTIGGAVVGALVGGPVGAVVGAGVGAAAANVSPTAEVIDYVNTNPLDPVYLDGEVQVGVGVPEGVEIVEVPGSDYRYANINGTPVLIDPGTRQVVYVQR